MTTAEKVKQQKNRLVKFCQELEFENEHIADNQNSVYFKKGSFRIRISNHFGLPDPKNISIVISSENPRQFIVSCSDSVFVLSSLADIKSFIKNAYRITNFAEQISKQKDEERIKKINELQTSINKYQSVNTRQNKSDLRNLVMCANLTNRQRNQIINQLENYGAI